MDLFAETQNAYTVDLDLMEMLGLKTTGYTREGTPIGVVTFDNNATVAVTVSAFPAQFFKFAIERPGEGILEVHTGSGTLRDFWWVACLLAENGFDYRTREMKALIKQDMLVLGDASTSGLYQYNECREIAYAGTSSGSGYSRSVLVEKSLAARACRGSRSTARSPGACTPRRMARRGSPSDIPDPPKLTVGSALWTRRRSRRRSDTTWRVAWSSRAIRGLLA
jgi:hypothetical protein